MLILRLLIYAFSSIMMLNLISCKKNNRAAAVEASADFSKAFNYNAKFDESSSVLKIEVSLQSGFHAYAPGEAIGKPVNLVVNEENGWMPMGKAILPAGEKKTLSVGESFVLDGTFLIVQPVKKGKSPGKAILYLQICTNTQCDRPRTHEIVFN